MTDARLLVLVAAAVAAAAGTAPSAIAAGPAYGSVEDAAALDRIFAAIRADAAAAGTRAELTRLDRRAGYLVTLTYSRPWKVKFGAALPRLRAEARREFSLTAEAINRRAREIGTEGDYAETWGDR